MHLKPLKFLSPSFITMCHQELCWFYFTPSRYLLPGQSCLQSMPRISKWLQGIRLVISVHLESSTLFHLDPVAATVLYHS